MDEYTNLNGQSYEPIKLGPNYNKVSESVRRIAPAGLACSVFCGGKRCKYESGVNWPSDSCAITGLFSHWVNDDVLAMARLSTALIEEFDILGQFETVGIKSVINLETPGEHASCSVLPLHPSGFSYEPNALMERGIYFYNYAWKDYGDASLAHLLDMVKVMSFAVQQGKVAVHCHAGLGRTGVLIACFLVYAQRLRANEAIRLVRTKRPGSIQSRLHILCVQQFEQFIIPNCMVFCNRELLKDKKIQDFTLAQYLKRQKFILHGRECKSLRNIPKVVNMVCERMLSLCGRPNVLPFVTEDNEMVLPLDSPGLVPSEMDNQSTSTNSNSNPNGSASLQSARTNSTDPLYQADEVVRALLSDHVHMIEGLAKYVRLYRIELNQKGYGAWIRLANEKNLYVLSALLYLWLEHLRNPLLGAEELTILVVHATDIDESMRKLPTETAATLDYVMHFIANLDPPGDVIDIVLKRLAAAFSHRIVPSTPTAKIYLGFHTLNHEKGKPRKLNEGTLSKIMILLHGLMERYKNGVLVPIKVTISSGF